MIPYTSIEKHYEYLTPLIMTASMETPSRWAAPYGAIDWPKIFTHIEMDAWCDIRGFGQVPLYPQYPVGKYWVDFGNPFLKIALECDGEMFHQDKDRDSRRDKVLKAMGWDVFRVPGRDCKKIIELDIYDEDYDLKLRDWYRETLGGLLKSLAVAYCGMQCSADEMGLVTECLYDRVSIKEGFSPFPEPDTYPKI